MRRRGRRGALRRRYGRAGYLAKPLAFPGVKSFGELFTSARPFDSSRDINVRGIKAKRGGREANEIGHYLVMSGRHGHESLYVTPSPMLVDWISNNMLAMGDRLHFEIVFRKDGALVIVSHGKIIGSRWLAMIDPSTVPVGD